MSEQIISMLGENASFLLDHTCEGIPVESIHAPGSDFVERIVSQSDRSVGVMRGRTSNEARHELAAQGFSGSQLDLLVSSKTFDGNRPTNSFLYRWLDPETLGALIAMYEHKIFTQGVVWNINSYDQMGVELGKHLAQAIFPELEGNEPVSNHDSSTNGLSNYYKQLR